MIKLTVKEMKNNENGFDIHLNTDKSSTVEFIASIISLMRGYQQYAKENGKNVSDNELLREVKRVLKKGSRIDELEVQKYE